MNCLATSRTQAVAFLVLTNILAHLLTKTSTFSPESCHFSHLPSAYCHRLVSLSIQMLLHFDAPYVCSHTRNNFLCHFSLSLHCSRSKRPTTDHSMCFVRAIVHQIPRLVFPFRNNSTTHSAKAIIFVCKHSIIFACFSFRSISCSSLLSDCCW